MQYLICNNLNFEDFNLDPDVLEGIKVMGFKHPSPVQEMAIPLIMEGHDMIACAQTGTGKTAAFMLPILHKILQLPADCINTLILVPTRELAIQIDQQVEAMGYFLNVRSIAVYGGGSGMGWVQQKQALSKGADIIIATPGRLIAQMQMGGLDFSGLKYLVLDEADRMLDMGFNDDIIKIVNALPKERQTLCFSATMPPKIRKLTKQILKDPRQVDIAISKPAEGIVQQAYKVQEEQKASLLQHILKDGGFKSVIVFSSSKEKVKRLETVLIKKGFVAKAFHSDLGQEDRERLMQAFKNHKIQILVGTDLLSRGVHVDGIDLVLNFDLPADAEDYVHRIGRTARAASTGTAITFVSPREQRKFQSIENLIGKDISLMELPATLAPAPLTDTHKPPHKGGGNGGPKRKFPKQGHHKRKTKTDGPQ